jgi:hypothetical protein
MTTLPTVSTEMEPYVRIREQLKLLCREVFSPLERRFSDILRPEISDYEFFIRGFECAYHTHYEIPADTAYITRCVEVYLATGIAPAFVIRTIQRCIEAEKH